MSQSSFPLITLVTFLTIASLIHFYSTENLEKPKLERKSIVQNEKVNRTDALIKSYRDQKVKLDLLENEIKRLQKTIQTTKTTTTLLKTTTFESTTTTASPTTKLLSKPPKTTTSNYKTPSSNWICPFDYTETPTEPIISPSNIRKTHFLINLSPFGPNNQFRGFRDTILLSHLLNRTIVLPLFFKHNSDPSQNSQKSHFQPANQRVDINSLKKFIPVITFEEFSKQCKNEGIGASLFARTKFGYHPYHWLKIYEDLSGVKMVKNQSYTAFMKKPNISETIIFPEDAADGKYNFVNRFKDGSSQFYLQVRQQIEKVKKFVWNYLFRDINF